MIDPELQPYFTQREHLIFGTSGELLLRVDILKSYNDANGHPGQKQTSGPIRGFGKTLFLVTKRNLRPKVPPQGLAETSGPWEIISCDLIGPLPITDS